MEGYLVAGTSSGLRWTESSFSNTVEHGSCPDSVEQTILLPVAGGVRSAGEAVRVRNMKAFHFYSADSSAGVVDGEYQIWDASLIAIKALKKLNCLAQRQETARCLWWRPEAAGVPVGPRRAGKSWRGEGGDVCISSSWCGSSAPVPDVEPSYPTTRHCSRS